MLRALLQGGTILLLLLVLALALRSALAKRPERFATAARQITPCPLSPNCVSSRSTDPAHRVDPLSFEAPPEETLPRLRGLLEALSRTRVITADGSYLHAECTSRFFRFVDDLELLLDREDAVVHVRSASRIGYSDFGANRRRVEALRALFSE